MTITGSAEPLFDNSAKLRNRSTIELQAACLVQCPLWLVLHDLVLSHSGPTEGTEMKNKRNFSEIPGGFASNVAFCLRNDDDTVRGGTHVNCFKCLLLPLCGHWLALFQHRVNAEHSFLLCCMKTLFSICQ